MRDEPPAAELSRQSAPKTDRGGAARWRSGTLLVLILLVAAVLSLASLQPRPALPAEADPLDFSATRAMAHVEAIAGGPRPAGSHAHRLAREYIVAVLRELGVEAEVQTGAANSTRYGLPFDSATVNNVVARVRGTAPDRPVVLTCHYDTLPMSPGAADDGAGVATLLETARALVAGPRLRQDVVFLFTDAEEIGAVGAERYLAANGPSAADALVLNFDARGTAGPVGLIETGPDNGALIRELARLDGTPAASSLLPALARLHGLGTDFRPFREAGAQGLNFAIADNVAYYHTPKDEPSTLDPRSLQQQGDIALGLARGLGSLAGVEPESDAVSFTVPGLGLVSLPVPVAHGISLAATLLFAWLAFRSLRAGTLRPREVLTALPATLVAWSAVALVSHGAWLAVRALDRTAAFLVTADTYRAGPYRFGLALVALATALAAYRTLRRFASVAALALSCGLLWAALLWACVAFVPGASYAFALPLACFCAAAILLLPPRDRPKAIEARVAIATLAAAPVAVVWAPIPYFLFAGLQLSAAGAVALAIALPAFLIATLVEACALPIRWWAAGLTGAMAAVLVVYGLGVAGFDAERPRPVSLAYALDTESNRGYWVSDRAKTSAVTEPAMAREVSPAELPAFFGEDGAVVRAAEGQVVNAPGPELLLLRDAVSGDRRTLVFRVRSRRAAPWLFAFLESDTRVLETAIDGVPVLGRPVTDPAPAGTRWGFRHVGLTGDGVEWSLTIDRSDEPVKIVVVDQSSGLPEVFALPPDAMFARSWISGTTLVRAAYRF